jgi:SAM-dependent methyltransferase
MRGAQRRADDRRQKSRDVEILSRAYRHLRQAVAGDLGRNAAFRAARRRMRSGRLTSEERHLLGESALNAGVADGSSGPADLTDDERRLLGRISLRVHPADDMYKPGNPGHYLAVGLSAVRCIRQALVASAATETVRAILDFPCGYGRVLRFLKAIFPDSSIVGCDINAAALSFCQRVFSVRGVLSSQAFEAVPLSERFDLIWCGSLITHVDEGAAANLLRLFHSHLSDRGICIFSTHGQRSVDWIKNGDRGYGLSQEGQAIVLRGFHDRGYGYADYPDRAGYGISVVSHDRMVETASAVGEWKETFFLEHGWGNHHDVYGFTMSMPRAIASL